MLDEEKCFECKVEQRANNKIICRKCAERINAQHIEQLLARRGEVAEELNNVSSKVDSGRHRLADVQKMHRLCAEYLALEERLENARK